MGCTHMHVSTLILPAPLPRTSFRGHKFKNKIVQNSKMATEEHSPSMGSAAPGACVPVWLPPVPPAPPREAVPVPLLPPLVDAVCSPLGPLGAGLCMSHWSLAPSPNTGTATSTNLLNKHIDHPLSLGEHLRWDRHLQDPHTDSFCPQGFPASFPPDTF